MTRVDTIESTKVWNELKSFENSINWNDNKFIGNDSNIKFSLTPAMSTRSIYVKMVNWNTEETLEVRISDHQTGMKATSKDFYFTFDNFNITEIKNIYNNFNN
jgi:hypothetical protein